jgi:methylenetetrahydrofolate reductase (NADPH)
MGKRESRPGAEKDREGGSEDMKSQSNLERILEKGVFAVTAQLNPPQGNDPRVVEAKAESLKGHVDAVNVTDNQTAVVRMSSLATSSMLLDMELEPIMHVVTRDRNRIAIQSDVLGATAMGVKNILCLTGDHQSLGNQVDSKNVHDLDSLQLIDCLRVLRDEGTLLGGTEKFNGEIQVYIGGAANPFGGPFAFRVTRLAKKIAAGADFIQTQSIFNMSRFKEWMKMARDQGLHKRVHILAGVTPLKSVETCAHINQSVPGITVSDDAMDRMAKARNPAEEGVRICVEQIEELKEIEGIRGVHIAAIDWEEKVGEIVDRAGLLPRPGVS